MMNFQKMMQQAQQMQMKLNEIQEKFTDIEVEGESGGGMVKVVMNCRGEVRSIDIDPSIMADKEMVEDLVAAAVNNANAAKDVKVQQETQAIMKELGLPEGTSLPF